MQNTAQGPTFGYPKVGPWAIKKADAIITITSTVSTFFYFLFIRLEGNVNHLQVE